LSGEGVGEVVADEIAHKVPVRPVTGVVGNLFVLDDAVIVDDERGYDPGRPSLVSSVPL